jgi:hypothetical protein
MEFLIDASLLQGMKTLFLGWQGDLCDVPLCKRGCDPQQGYCKVWTVSNLSISLSKASFLFSVQTNVAASSVSTATFASDAFHFQDVRTEVAGNLSNATAGSHTA